MGPWVAAKVWPTAQSRMQIWLFNQLVEEIQSALAWARTRGSVRGPFFSQSHQKTPLLHSCAGLLRRPAHL